MILIRKDKVSSRIIGRVRSNCSSQTGLKFHLPLGSFKIAKALISTNNTSWAKNTMKKNPIMMRMRRPRISITDIKMSMMLKVASRMEELSMIFRRYIRRKRGKKGHSLNQKCPTTNQEYLLTLVLTVYREWSMI